MGTGETHVYVHKSYASKHAINSKIHRSTAEKKLSKEVGNNTNLSNKSCRLFEVLVFYKTKYIELYLAKFQT